MKKNKKLIFIVLIFVVSLFFLDNINAETYNNYSNVRVTCGEGMLSGIPSLIPKVVSIAYTVIQIAVQVVLVVMGSLDLLKGIKAQKEDEIKKGQKIFVKRLVGAALVFFVFVIVKFIISFVADSSGSKIMDCATCLIENKCEVEQNN